MNDASIFAVTALWALSAVVAIWSFGRVLRHSLRAQRALRDGGVNGVYAHVARTSIQQDWIGMALGVLMVALLLGTLAPLDRDLRSHVIRTTLAAIGFLIAYLGHKKLDGETVSRSLIRKERELEAAREADRIGEVAKAIEAHAEIATQTLSTIKVILPLVNTNLTTSMKAELSSVRRELALLKGQQGSGEAIAVAEARIAELEAALKDREAQDAAAERQIKEQGGA